jgi:dicarboxylate transporter 10
VDLFVLIACSYRHALDGLYRIVRHEGAKTLFNGSTMATARAVLLNIGQLAIYDQCKQLLLLHTNGLMQDNLVTHFSASLIAGAIATTITHPLDVLKVRMMNAPASASKGIGSCAAALVREAGLIGFLHGKRSVRFVSMSIAITHLLFVTIRPTGYWPAFIRLGPQTILTFIFFEQLRLNFGYVRQDKPIV